MCQILSKIFTVTDVTPKDLQKFRNEMSEKIEDSQLRFPRIIRIDDLCRIGKLFLKKKIQISSNSKVRMVENSPFHHCLNK